MCDRCKISVNINITCNERKVDSYENPYAIYCPQCNDMVGMGLPGTTATTNDCPRCHSKQ